MADQWTPEVCKEYEEWCREIDVKDSWEVRRILEILEILSGTPDELREGIFTEASKPIDYDS